jgi:hypothetical protein
MENQTAKRWNADNSIINEVFIMEIHKVKQVIDEASGQYLFNDGTRIHALTQYHFRSLS